ncbi:serine--tRNA ligase [Candidatus Sumerlaeota bacterium]|nr:serine--tRNA ligase [Candidatus Sumerlaeota bacterium]
MLDIHLFRNDPDRVTEGLRAKKADPSLVTRVQDLDAQRRDLTYRAELLKKERNEASKDVGKILKQGGDAEPIKERVRQIGDEIRTLDAQADEVTRQLEDILLVIPNLPHSSVPVGQSEEDNVVVRDWGEKPRFDFAPKPHWELGESLDILELERAARMSGSMFFGLKGRGARLQRALIDFMLDMHVERHGYTEVRVPYLVNRKTLTGTGQLPKFESDMYRIESDDLFLISTSEVPVTNLHAGEILGASDLPKTYVCYSPCFRREAGAAGKDTRGMTRTHQFDKVEMVRTVLPETSYDEIESLLGHVEAVLRALGLHYRVVELCTADLSFAAAKCYDVEVWAPGMERYLEVSSCSNFEDFQARRAGIRFRREKGAKPEFPHTLNASGVALPRLMIALLESSQQANGSVSIPEILRPYTRFDQIA